MIMIKIILAPNYSWTLGPPLGWSCCYNEHAQCTVHCTALHVVCNTPNCHCWRRAH